MKALSDKYLKFIVTELKPYIDKNYCPAPSKNSTFLAGSSMGGLISMYGLLKYPEFLVVQPAFPHIGRRQCSKMMSCQMRFLRGWKKKLPAEPDFRLYFDHGTETIDSLYAHGKGRPMIF